MSFSGCNYVLRKSRIHVVFSDLKDWKPFFFLFINDLNILNLLYISCCLGQIDMSALLFLNLMFFKAKAYLNSAYAGFRGESANIQCHRERDFLKYQTKELGRYKKKYISFRVHKQSSNDNEQIAKQYISLKGRPHNK